MSVGVPVGAHARLCVPTFGKRMHAIEMRESDKTLWSAAKYVPVAGCTSGTPIGAPEGWIPACNPPQCLDAICFECGAGRYEITLLA